jgi:hypothetical protein
MSRNYHLRDLNIPVGGHLPSRVISAVRTSSTGFLVYAHIHYSRNIISIRTRTRRRRVIVIIKASRKHEFTVYMADGLFGLPAKCTHKYEYVFDCLHYKGFTWEIIIIIKKKNANQSFPLLLRSNDDNMWTTIDYYTIITAIYR